MHRIFGLKAKLMATIIERAFPPFFLRPDWVMDPATRAHMMGWPTRMPERHPFFWHKDRPLLGALHPELLK